MAKTVPKSSLSSLIQKSLLISPQTKEQLLKFLDKFSKKQQEEVKLAIQEAESELTNILAKSLNQNPQKISQIEHQLERVWKHYIQDVEAISDTSEEQKQQNLLDSL